MVTYKFMALHWEADLEIQANSERGAWKMLGVLVKRVEQWRLS